MRNHNRGGLLIERFKLGENQGHNGRWRFMRERAVNMKKNKPLQNESLINSWKMPKNQPDFIFFLASHTTGPSPSILYSVLVTQ